MRYNGGGYWILPSGWCQSLSPGIVMHEEYGDGTRRIRSPPGRCSTDIPLIVLVNEGSASASKSWLEPSDLARQTGWNDHLWQRFRTELRTLVNDEGAVRVTIARWLTPMVARSRRGVGPRLRGRNCRSGCDAGIDAQLQKPSNCSRRGFSKSLDGLKIE
jgi:carboxyl-terminal processing protease